MLSHVFQTRKLLYLTLRISVAVRAWTSACMNTVRNQRRPSDTVSPSLPSTPHLDQPDPVYHPLVPLLPPEQQPLVESENESGSDEETSQPRPSVVRPLRGSSKLVVLLALSLAFLICIVFSVRNWSSYEVSLRPWCSLYLLRVRKT